MPPEMELRQTGEGRIIASVGINVAEIAEAETIARRRFAQAKALLRGAEGLEFDFHRSAIGRYQARAAPSALFARSFRLN